MSASLGQTARRPDGWIVRANGVDLCVETMGNSSDPAVLLIHGAAASMMGWPDRFLNRLVAGNVFVIRFDHRDTGQSVSYPPGAPGYSIPDLANDAIGILDALGVTEAHIVGASMGGGIGQLLALEHAERIKSLTLIATTPGGTDLPPPSPEFVAHVTSGETPDWSDDDAVVEHIMRLFRAISGGPGILDEDLIRCMLITDLRRSTANTQSTHINHFAADQGQPIRHRLDDITTPTLVLHGERDVIFPIEHAHALGAEIPNARVTILEDAGHALMWQKAVESADAILEQVTGISKR